MEERRWVPSANIPIISPVFLMVIKRVSKYILLSCTVCGMGRMHRIVGTALSVDHTEGRALLAGKLTLTDRSSFPGRLFGSRRQDRLGIIRFRASQWTHGSLHPLRCNWDMDVDGNGVSWKIGR